MATVYLETSFVSACVSRRKDAPSAYRRQISTEWWDTQRHKHDLFTSLEVIDELEDARHRQKDAALKLIEGVPLLNIDEEVRGVAQILVNDRVMPGPLSGDAIHVATAAMHHIEYIISWNVRHLANPNKMAHLRVVCRRIALIAPQILTPDLLWENE
ncbi:MAG TPA: PIN domain-containing protein [Phycisphaerae bacterium]|nr:PIN domain-containing protein [Phycisphaerae bacterium]